MMFKCEYGVPAQRIYAPVFFLVADKPDAFGSKGQMIIHCGPVLTIAPASLRSVVA